MCVVSVYDAAIRDAVTMDTRKRKFKSSRRSCIVTRIFSIRLRRIEGIASEFEMICEEWRKYFLVEEIKFYC